MDYTVYHQCRGWNLESGTQGGCRVCQRGELRPRVSQELKKPRYTFEEARQQIDRCAGCGVKIHEQHLYHHCHKCLPKWKRRIEKLNQDQEREWGDD